MTLSAAGGLGTIMYLHKVSDTALAGRSNVSSIRAPLSLKSALLIKKKLE